MNRASDARLFRVATMTLIIGVTGNVCSTLYPIEVADRIAWMTTLQCSYHRPQGGTGEDSVKLQQLAKPDRIYFANGVAMVPQTSQWRDLGHNTQEPCKAQKGDELLIALEQSLTNMMQHQTMGRMRTHIAGWQTTADQRVVAKNIILMTAVAA